MTLSLFRLTRSFFLVGLLFTTLGCQQQLETRYAAIRGESINGISTFIQALRGSKHRVDTFSFLTPMLGESHDCIIIFADNYGQPDKKTVEALQSLVRGHRVRTILWVIKNGDVSTTYWNQLLAGNRLSEKQKEVATREREFSQSSELADRSLTFKLDKEGLYGLENPKRNSSGKLTKVTLTGNPSRTVEALWPLQRKLIPKPRADVLWDAAGEPLLVEDFYQNTRVLFLASGMPLLNASMVDPGNRILTESLIQLIGDDLKQQIGENHRIAIVPTTRFLEKSDSQSESGMLHFLKVQPFPWIIGQMVLAMLLFCWWKFPIFGRPLLATHRELQQFSRHVEALGELLWRTQGNTFVLSRIREWQRVRKTQGKKVKEN